MKKRDPVEPASALIDEKIQKLVRGSPRCATADPEIVEDGVGDARLVPRRPRLHRRDVQERRQDDLARGAALKDSSGLFNSSLDGNVRRAIDIHEGEKVDEAALKALVRAAVALNLEGKGQAKPRRASRQPAD